MRRDLNVTIVTILILLAAARGYSTHLRAGEITAVRTSCTSLTFVITITVFLDTESGVTFGGAWLDMGDNGKNSRIFIEEQATVQRPDLGPHMGMATIKKEYTYAGFGSYTITYAEEFRNEDIVNMTNSGSNQFYLTTTIILDPFLSCNQSLPVLLIPPIDRACTGVAFFHNPGAVDLDGDSLSYEMVTPWRDRNEPVWDYKQPINFDFYRDFNLANESRNGPPTFSINSTDGTIKWDAPGDVGEYNIAFHVIEWRKSSDGKWRKMSTVRRDMQIIVDDCDNNRPDLSIPNDTCVVAGANIKKTIYGFDPDKDDVKIEVYSEVLFLSSSPATFLPDPKFQSSVPAATLVLEWNTKCEHVKEQYYDVVFKITDKPKGGFPLVTFKTWKIRVVGPAPVWSVSNNPEENQYPVLEWNDYACKNASQMQIWRKVDGSLYEPAHCDTGMPAFLGYDLIETIALRDPITNEPVTRFTDIRYLAPGAKYCYRLVALYPSPKGGESYVSKDTCFIFSDSDAPVITNVSVEKTHASEGKIKVIWQSPLDIDIAKFPGPYRYEVYRATGFDTKNLVLVSAPAGITDTVFLDTGIDTEHESFTYRIVLYSNTAADHSSYTPIDTSAFASSVWLETSAMPDYIELSWKASVPWLNSSYRYPYHLVFRGTNTALENEFLLIDSVQVTESGFYYRDEGKFQDTPLDKNSTYSYRIRTRGAYGNIAIAEPLENYSQVVFVSPDEDGKPCSPTVSISQPDCNEVFSLAQCAVREFSNRISWRVDCSEQVRSYRVYAALRPDTEFVMIAENIKDTTFLDRNLTSFARCYKVVSVDGRGKESAYSEIICNDNCPYFELPNIFTPNGDGCNDYFSAFGPFNPLTQRVPDHCALNQNNYNNCVRFVENVSIAVYNRWGKEVYTYNSNKSEDSIYINWDGKDNEGIWLSSGVYYYIARVNFDVIKPEQAQQTLKGWVHLTR
jgi:hypothetical protein